MTNFNAELDKILDEVINSKYNYTDYRVKRWRISQTILSITELVKKIVPSEKEIPD